VSYSIQEKTILKVLKENPRINYNQLQIESDIPKKTFEKHLKSLVERGKVRFYAYEGKNHYLIRTGKSKKEFESLPLSHDEQIEWKIVWKSQESQELFNALEKSITTQFLNKSDIQFARFVFENMLQNVLSLTIHDALLDPLHNPHQKFIKKYKKLIRGFFEFIQGKEFSNLQSNEIVSENDKSKSEKKLINGARKFKTKVITAELEPFAEEISRLYSDEWSSDSNDNTEPDQILTGNVKFDILSLILDESKTENLK